MLKSQRDKKLRAGQNKIIVIDDHFKRGNWPEEDEEVRVYVTDGQHSAEAKHLQEAEDILRSIK